MCAADPLPSPIPLTLPPPPQASQHPRCRVRVTLVRRQRGDKGAAALAAALVAGKAWAADGLGSKFQLSGVMVTSSQPALWANPQQADALLEAVGGAAR